MANRGFRTRCCTAVSHGWPTGHNLAAAKNTTPILDKEREVKIHPCVACTIYSQLSQGTEITGNLERG